MHTIYHVLYFLRLNVVRCISSVIYFSKNLLLANIAHKLKEIGKLFLLIATQNIKHYSYIYNIWIYYLIISRLLI